jgi:hypothetical protein
VVKADWPLQIYYGGWGVKGKELADQWWTALTAEFTIDGQPISGEIQLPTTDLPYNCSPSKEETYWLYYMVIIPGLSAGDHDVSVKFYSLRALSDGTGYTFGPGLLFENTFKITAQ